MNALALHSCPPGDPAPAIPDASDHYFDDPASGAADFKFTGKVAGVFDDMVGRSVPFYEEIQRMIAEISADYVQPGTNVYDLGCATGATLLNLDATVTPEAGFVGIDNAPEMLERCREKFASQEMRRPVKLVVADLEDDLQIENASVVLLVLTLQFIRPLQRERLISNIVRGLNHNGALILVEKVLGEDSLFNRQFIKYYYEMKRRHGYSEMEIYRKREALENVLVPYRHTENKQLLMQSGLRTCDTFFKWYNFTGMIAVK